MISLPSGSFTLALLFGAVSVFFHARNQFNRSTYDQSPEFRRLLEKLQPSDMRRGGAYVQAFVLYTVVLLLVYLLLCLYLTVPSLQQLGVGITGLEFAGAAKIPEQVTKPVAGIAFDEAGGILGRIGERSGPDPSIPLAVSLAVVGLAPNVPLLWRLESYVRVTAHRLSGYPTRLVDSGLALRRHVLPEDTLLLIGTDLERLARYRAAAEVAKLAEVEALVADVGKILKFRRWIIARRIYVPGEVVRLAKVPVEDEVVRRIDNLLLELDAATAPRDAGATGGAVRTPGADWRKLTQEIEETVEDLCLYVSLLCEQRAFVEAVETAAERSVSKEDLVAAQRQQAAAQLAEALEGAELLSDRGTVGMTMFFRLAGAIVLLAALGAWLWGRSRQENPGDLGTFELVLAFAISATLTYVVALAFMLSYQQEAVKRQNWENAFDPEGKWSRIVPQLTLVFVASTLLALFSRVAYNIYSAGQRVGFEKVQDNFSSVMASAIGIEFPDALLGGVYCLFIVLMIDAWAMGKIERVRWRTVPLLAFSLAVVAAWARLNQTWLNVVDTNVIVQDVARAAATPALIGLVSGIYASQVLRDEFSTASGEAAGSRLRTRRVPMPRFGGEAFAGLLAALAVGPGFAAGPVQIGVRIDAPPFAWQEPESDVFRGYLRDVCVEAATRAGFTFVEVAVTGAQRNGVIEGNPDIGNGVRLDVLCDPTTISLARLEKLEALDELLVFSPILFVANGSYMQRTDIAPRPARQDGAFAFSPACFFPDMKVTETLDGFFGTEGSYLVFGYLAGSTSESNILRGARENNPPQGDSRMCLRAFESHADGVKALCNGEVDYYYGDVDIIDALRSRVDAGASSRARTSR